MTELLPYAAHPWYPICWHSRYLVSNFVASEASHSLTRFCSLLRVIGSVLDCCLGESQQRNCSGYTTLLVRFLVPTLLSLSRKPRIPRQYLMKKCCRVGFEPTINRSWAYRFSPLSYRSNHVQLGSNFGIPKLKPTVLND